MKFMERFRKDKAYRIKVIIIAVLIIFIWTKGGGEKKEADWDTCLSYNINAGFCILMPIYLGKTTLDFPYGCVVLENRNLCLANNCVIGEQVQFGTNPDACLPYVPTSWVTTNADDCQSGCFESYGEDKVLCRVCEEDEKPETCNSREESVGKILSSVFPRMGCKSRYYIALFGGGFAALMMFMAVM